MTATKTLDAARGRWAGLLPHFGVDPKFLTKRQGPCPICGGKTRFTWDNCEDNGGFYCNHCGAGTGIRLVMEMNTWTWAQACAAIDKVIGNFPEHHEPQKPAPDKRSHMIQLWKSSRQVTAGDPVWRYLESRCGDPAGFLQDVRFHPALKHSVSGTTHPGMLVALRPNAGKAIGVHRTFLTPDGRKADVDPVRMTYGELAQAQLGPVTERMGIAEGIETAICSSKLFGCPVWAAICANGLRTWEPPEAVKTVVICGDNDASFTGQEAAYSLAYRLAHLGLNVEMQIPAVAGTDFQDTWQSKFQPVAA